MTNESWSILKVQLKAHLLRGRVCRVAVPDSLQRSSSVSSSPDGKPTHLHRHLPQLKISLVICTTHWHYTYQGIRCLAPPDPVLIFRSGQHHQRGNPASSYTWEKGTTQETKRLLYIFSHYNILDCNIRLWELTHQASSPGSERAVFCETMYKVVPR